MQQRNGKTVAEATLTCYIRGVNALAKTTSTVLAVTALLVVCRAESPRPSVSSNEWGHIHRALDILNMTPADPGFDKDAGEPLYVLDHVRGLLAAPDRLPAEGDRLRAAVAAGGAADLFSLSRVWMEAVESAPPPVGAAGATRASAASLGEGAAGLSPGLAEALVAFLREATDARALLERAFESLDRDEMQYAAAALLADEFGDGSGGLLAQAGIGPRAVAAANVSSDAMDPEPHAKHLLVILNGVDYASMLAAGGRFVAALEKLARAAQGVADWPGVALQIPTPLGTICVGTLRDDIHAVPALLVVDPGGDDLYRGESGAANGLLGRSLAGIIDLAGGDRYVGKGLLGQAGALFGAAVLLDLGGNDRYTCANAGSGCAVFGTGWLEDRAGDDTYAGKAVAQGAAFAGLGVLRDRCGNDLYRVGKCGQAFAGVRGAGLLVDDAGKDVYLAGRWEADHERHSAHSLSLAQGFSTGMRPFIGGGVAALVDRGGNDTYEADVYGQGVSYWYALGMLVDESGHDAYRLHEYGQGTGIHLSAGLLVEGGGNDVYYGHSLAQGAAHDYAVGLLVDHGGNDMYTADHYSQGRALNNSYALLLDVMGDDGYFARRPAISQGVGDDGKRREYGSISLLIDLAGKDRYTCGGRDGQALIRPNHGVVYEKP